MIYLIKTAVFIDGDVEEEDSAILALKIGYSRDERGNGRFNDYTTNGLNIRVLKTIPGGSYNLENKLHHLFKDYNIPSRSREWFYYEKEIVDIFNSCSTETDLYGLFGISSEEELLKEKLDSRSDRYKFNYELSLKIDKFKEDYGNTKNSVYKALEYLQKLTTFANRMKSICDNVYNLSQEDFEVFLEYVPSIMADFYNVLGPERIYSLGLQKSKLYKEYKLLINSKIRESKLVEKIISSFIPGEKYPKSQIKGILQDLYKMFDIKKAVTATDLMEYFDIKPTKLTTTVNGISKRVAGFEILSLRNEQNSTPSTPSTLNVN